MSTRLLWKVELNHSGHFQKMPHRVTDTGLTTSEEGESRDPHVLCLLPSEWGQINEKLRAKWWWTCCPAPVKVGRCGFQTDGVNMRKLLQSGLTGRQQQGYRERVRLFWSLKPLAVAGLAWFCSTQEEVKPQCDLSPAALTDSLFQQLSLICAWNAGKMINLTQSCCSALSLLLCEWVSAEVRICWFVCECSRLCHMGQLWGSEPKKVKIWTEYRDNRRTSTHHDPVAHWTHHRLKVSSFGPTWGLHKVLIGF